MVRTMLAVVFGTLIAGSMIAAAWYASAHVYSLPDETTFSTSESLSLYAAGTPTMALVWILIGWAAGGFAGGATAARIARTQDGGAALTVGAMLTAVVILYARLIPNSEWVTVIGVLLPLPCATMAALLLMPRAAVSGYP
jgi:hypothetical protein